MSSDKHNVITRRPIWEALSEFYLDTELDENDFKIMIKAFKQSPYTLAEIKAIDLYEVYPLLQANLHSLAGEWAGFDSDWLFQKCEENFKRRHRKWFRIACKISNFFWYWMRRRYWVAIDALWKEEEN